MRCLWVAFTSFAAAISIAQVGGDYKGRLIPNRKLFLGRTPADGQKLMSYALDRLEAASLNLSLQADGQFVITFDDGYGPDRFTMTGSYKWDGKRILLIPVDHRAPTHSLVQTNPGVFTDSQMIGMPKGIAVAFSAKSAR